MLSCFDATFLMSQRRERPLTRYERVRVRVHAAICPACQRFEDQLPSLGAAARAFAQPEDGTSK